MNWGILLLILIYGIEVYESQKTISGLVQNDKDALGGGQIKQSSHGTDDMGLYGCEVENGKLIEPLKVNVAQTYYQAQENRNITLEWMFSTRPYRSTEPLISCDYNDSISLYHVSGGEVSESQDKKFSGRVQSDKDALREGRIRLQLIRLRTDDSGLYRCEVQIYHCRGSANCQLNVTAFPKYHLETPTVRPQPESKESFSTVGLIVGILVVFICGVIYIIFRRIKKTGNHLEENPFVCYHSISAESSNQPTVSSTSV